MSLTTETNLSNMGQGSFVLHAHFVQVANYFNKMDHHLKINSYLVGAKPHKEDGNGFRSCHRNQKKRICQQ